MTHLTPEQRVDKNGKVTTRHVRSETKGAAAPTLLPAPAVTVPALSPRQAATAAWKELESAGLTYSSAVIPNLEYVASHDRELLDSVVERYTGNAGISERALWQGMITFTGLCPDESLTDAERSVIDPELVLSSYRSGLEFFNLIGRLNPTVSGRTLDHYHSAAQRFNLAGLMVPEGRDLSDPDTIKAVLLVMRVEEMRGSVDWDAEWARTALDHKSDDIRYLADNMGRVEPVLEGLLTMQATDAQAVESLLGTKSSLWDGAL